MPELDLDTQVKLAIYEITAETGSVPNSSQVSRKINIEEDEVLAAFRQLYAKRLLRRLDISLASGVGCVSFRSRPISPCSLEN